MPLLPFPNESETMNNAELIDHVATATGLSKTGAREAVSAIVDGIASAAKQGHGVSIAGFGQFKVSDKPARLGRNPATGETITIQASRKLAFTPAKALKERLNG